MGSFVYVTKLMQSLYKDLACRLIFSFGPGPCAASRHHLATVESCCQLNGLASMCTNIMSATIIVCGAGVEMSAQMRWRPAYRSLPASLGRTKLMPPMAPRPPGFAPPFHAPDRPAREPLLSS